MTDAEVDDIVSRYERGQSLKFIQYATDHARRTILAALKSRGVKVKKPGKQASGSWGWTGGHT